MYGLAVLFVPFILWAITSSIVSYFDANKILYAAGHNYRESYNHHIAGAIESLQIAFYYVAIYCIIGFYLGGWIA